jgi:hypothetical protein
MKKLCALIAFMFVLSLAGGVFGQDNRNRRDNNMKGQDQTKRDSDKGYNRGNNTSRGRHHRHRRHRNYKRIRHNGN